MVAAVAIGLVLARGRFGRYVRAIGYNREAARFSGVPIGRVTVAVYVLTGLLVAIASIIYTSRVSSARADSGLGLELDVIAAVVLGGASVRGGSGTVIATVLGVLIIAVLRNGLFMAGVPSTWQLVILGAVLIARRVRERAQARGLVMRRLGAWCAAAALALGAGSCGIGKGAPDIGTGAASDGKTKVCMMPKLVGIPYFNATERGAQRRRARARRRARLQRADRRDGRAPGRVHPAVGAAALRRDHRRRQRSRRARARAEGGAAGGREDRLLGRRRAEGRARLLRQPGDVQGDRRRR